MKLPYSGNMLLYAVSIYGVLASTKQIVSLFFVFTQKNLLFTNYLLHF